MGHHHHGHAHLGQLLHNVQHLANHFRVQGAGGLVKQHDLRLHAQGTDNGDPLLLTAGKLGGVSPRPVGKAHTGQQGHGLFLGLGLGFSQKLGGAKGQIFQNGHMGEQVEMLEHHAHLLTVQVDVDLFGGEGGTVKGDLTAGGTLQQVQAAQEGGLAAAGGADDHQHIALMDIYAYAVQGVDAAAVKMLFQILYGNNGISAHCFSASFPVFRSAN